MEYTRNFTFLNGADAATTGEVLKNACNTELAVSVEGTFTATVKMQGHLGNEWHDLSVVDLGSMELASTITSTGAYTVVCPVAFDEIRANLTTISSGSVTVIGRVFGGEANAQ